MVRFQIRMIKVFWARESLVREFLFRVTEINRGLPTAGSMDSELVGFPVSLNQSATTVDSMRIRDLTKFMIIGPGGILRQCR
jgi:hypothetical protein